MRTRGGTRVARAPWLAALLLLLMWQGTGWGATPATSSAATPPPASRPAKAKPAKERIADLESEVARLKAALARADEELAEHRAMSAELVTTAAAVGKRLDAMEKELADLRASGPESTEAADDEEPLENMDARLTEVELRMAENEGRFLKGGLGGFTFSGTLVTAVGYVNGPDLTLNGDLVDTQDDFDFFVDAIELDVARSFAGMVRLRLDLDVLVDLRLGEAADFRLSVEQAYAEATLPVLDGIHIRLGRWSDEIGWEPTDRESLWLFTHTAGFALIQPKLFTGVRVSVPLFKRLDISAMAVNGIGDNIDLKNFGKTFAATVEVGAARDEVVDRRHWWVRAGFLVGSEQPEAVDDTENFKDTTIIASLSFEVPISTMRIGGHALFMRTYDALGGIAAFQGPSDAWAGQLAAHYPIKGRFEAVLRYDLFIDRRGVFFDAGQLIDGAGEMHALSAGVGAKLIDGARAGFEYRAELFLADDEIGPNCENKAGVEVTCGGVLGRDGAAHSVYAYFKIAF